MAHHNTVFAQLLKFIPRHEFESLENRHHAGLLCYSWIKKTLQSAKLAKRGKQKGCQRRECPASLWRA